MKKHIPLILVFLVALLSWALFAYCLKQVSRLEIGPYDGDQPRLSETASTTPLRRPVLDIVLPALKPDIKLGLARVTAQSAKVFAYAHGTAAARGKIYIGLADVAGNTFDANQLVMFDDVANIGRPSLIHLPLAGDIQDLIYDEINDRIYLLLSSNFALNIFSLNPDNKAISNIVSTTSVNVGRKPAIVTDGIYIYGIANTEPSNLFKVRISDGQLTVNFSGHISMGHSAALSRLGSTTELYFGGGMADEFEKADAAGLQPIAKTKISPCGMSDDMPFLKTAGFGYVYIGCEMVPYGIRLKTDDLTYERFSLPGYSLGLFVLNSDLYNAARDGFLDIFPKADLKELERYWVVNDTEPFETKGQNLEINEILYSAETGKLYFTAWYGIKGLYQVATSSLEALKPEVM